MRNYWLSLFVCLTLLLFEVATATEQTLPFVPFQNRAFLGLPASARITGFENRHIFLNPAELFGASKHQLSLEGNSSFFGYDQIRVGYLFPTDKFVVGIGFYQLSTTDIPRTVRGLDNRPVVQETFSDMYRLAELSVGFPLISDFLFTGGALRYYIHSLDSDSSESIIGDAGISVQLIPGFYIGFYSQNLVSSSLLWQGSGTEEFLVASYRYTADYSFAFGSVFARYDSDYFSLGGAFSPNRWLDLSLEGFFSEGINFSHCSVGMLLDISPLAIEYNYSQQFEAGLPDMTHRLGIHLSFLGSMEIQEPETDFTSQRSQISDSRIDRLMDQDYITVLPSMYSDSDNLIQFFSDLIHNYSNLSLFSRDRFMAYINNHGYSLMDLYQVQTALTLGENASVRYLVFLDERTSSTGLSLTIRVLDTIERAWYTAESRIDPDDITELRKFFAGLLNELNSK